MYTQTIPPDPLSVWNKPVKHVKRLTLKNNMSMNVLNLTEPAVSSNEDTICR
jgi:hypothetical protein